LAETYRKDTIMFGAILGSVLPGVLTDVLGKIVNQLPVSENEKENIKLQAERELATHAEAIANAETAISNNAKDAWLAELHNGGFLATSWRPLLALSSTLIIFWDGVLISIFNALGSGLEHTPAHVSEVSMWILLTLIGARGVEKISVVTRKPK
jgi:hypothetical protein